MDASGDNFELKLGRIGHDRAPNLRRVRASVRQTSRITVKQKGRIAPRTGMRGHYAKVAKGTTKVTSLAQRRVVVKARYVVHGSGRGAPLRAHVSYLAREAKETARTPSEALGAEPTRELGRQVDYLSREASEGHAKFAFYDRSDMGLDAKGLTSGWSDESRHFRLIVSTGFTPQGLIDAAYDPYLPTFVALIPDLVAAYDALPSSDPRKAKLADPITALRGWDFKWSATSVPTALAVNWGEIAWAKVTPEARAGRRVAQDLIANTTPAEKLAALEEAVDKLKRDFGRWDVQWGEINRFQRLSSAITASFDDAKPSFPVPFTSAQWGSLANFGAQRYPNTKKVYGSNGNSFVAVVEFGPRVRARAVSAGGESGDAASRHFNDQIERYAKGDLRNVYFYPDELTGHIERTYQPGELSR